MNLYDTHLHSDFSPDSFEPMENYAKKAAENGDERLITTEHLDIDCYSDGFDIIPDFEKQYETTRYLSKKYNMDVLFGVEAAHRIDLVKRNNRIIKKYPFDMVILSVHEAPDKNMPRPWNRQDLTMQDRYNTYLHLAKQALVMNDDFDAFAHIDYPLRYIGHTDPARHEEILREIFSLVIQKDKALEINTKQFPDKMTVKRAEYFLKLYTDMGGKKITLGSDGHSVRVFKNGFDVAGQLLKGVGVDRVCVYKNRQESTILL